MAEVKFQVGQVYSNRDGEYKVLSIDPTGGRMEVRFLEGGLTRSLDMTIQSRICQNLQLEAKMAESSRVEKAAKAAKPTAEKKALGRDFSGMRPEDFTGTVNGTTWRSRGSLAGGVLARLQRQFKKPFKSVAVYNQPVVFMSHQPELSNAAAASHIARYTVQADTNGLHFGVYVERVDAECHDWERLVKRLREDETLRKIVTQLEQEGGIRVEGRRGHGPDRYYYFDGPRKGAEPLFPADASWETRMNALEAPVAEGETRELYVLRTLTVQEAVDRGMQIVEDVGDVFVKLAPFYSAAAI